MGSRDLPDGTRQGIVRIAFSTASMSGANSGQLMMFALPHHRRHLLNATAAPGASFPGPGQTTVRAWSLRGELRHVLGSDWFLAYNLSTIGFTATRPIGNAAWKAGVAAALLADVAGYAATNVFNATRDDPYYGGSDVAALGRLAVIADELAGDAALDAPTRTQLAAAASRARAIATESFNWCASGAGRAKAWGRCWVFGAKRLALD
jgi:hypothetical protein